MANGVLIICCNSACLTASAGTGGSYDWIFKLIRRPVANCHLTLEAFVHKSWTFLFQTN